MEGIFHSLHQPLPMHDAKLLPFHESFRSSRFHVGRPVKLGIQGQPADDALRLAVGAPLISEIAECYHDARNYEQKLEWIDERLSQFLKRLAFHIANWRPETHPKAHVAARRRAA
jgi:hypothetical protein